MVQLQNSQYSHFLQQADALRRSGSLCDVVISVDSQTFRAHRLVLACASRTLAQQLLQGASDQPLHWTLELFSPHTFQQVLDFSYSQALEVPHADLQQLLRASQLLEMDPLEEQCRSQLDTLRSQAGEAGDTKEPSQNTEEEREERQASKESPSPQSVEGSSSPPPLRKRSLPVIAVPTSEATKSRDSVITGHGPRSLSRYRWHSVNALRRMALNYSSHSLHPSQQALAHPFPLSTPHMYPWLASSIPAPRQGSVMGYHSILHPYTHTLLAGSPELGDIFKQGLLGKTDLAGKVLMGEGPGEGPRYGEECSGRAGRILECQHCARTLLERPWLHTSTSSSSGAASLGCGFCGRGYKLGHIVRSPRRGHSGEKPYECKCCPKRFSLKHQLDTHHRVHTGEKPFECRLCGQRSRDYSAMIKHLRTHGGASPYQCTMCLEYCSSLAAMQKHLKSHPVQDFPPDWGISSTYLYTCHS